MFYSKSTKGFYHLGLHGNSMPPDVVKISKETYESLLRDQSLGKAIISDANGFPIAVDAPAAPVHDLLARAKEELRTMRRDMLDAVTGIGFRASVAGNAALAQEAAAVSQQLLDITEDSALNAAQTYDAMRVAGVAAYRRIADAVSAELRTAFKQLEA